MRIMRTTLAVLVLVLASAGTGNGTATVVTGAPVAGTVRDRPVDAARDGAGVLG